MKDISNIFNNNMIVSKILSKFINERPKINPPHSVDQCICCGSYSLEQSIILWEDLINEWELTETEVEYMNRQQGLRCLRCKANLRTMALAYALMRNENYRGLFKNFVKTRRIKSKKVLEVNEAGWLTQYLQKLPLHYLAKYPEIDAQDMPFSDSSFDIIIHSDILEHIPNPDKAINEFFRILKPNGYCVFTVPMLVGKLSRSRAGLAPSHHGCGEQRIRDDYLVYTEFGTDMWERLTKVGFSEVRIYSLEFPAAQSFLCKK